MNKLMRYGTNHELKIEYGNIYDVELNIWQVGALLEYCKKSRIEPYQACEYILQQAANNWGRFKYEFLHKYVCLPVEYMHNLQYSFYNPEDKEFAKNNYNQLVDFYNDIHNRYTDEQLNKLVTITKNMLPTIKVKARTITVLEMIPFWERVEMQKELERRREKEIKDRMQAENDFFGK